eukprot:6483256-Amphidinium_carterae.2
MLVVLPCTVAVDLLLGLLWEVFWVVVVVAVDVLVDSAFKSFVEVVVAMLFVCRVVDVAGHDVSFCKP